MSDIKLFSTHTNGVRELPGESVALERSLQALIEANLNAMLGIRFLASEYSTGPRHGGRVDTLGLDENSCPVIIEYKRATNENVINQGLFYLDWLMDHRAEFELLVMMKLGPEAREAIDWSAPRLVCIAGGFTRYDEHAVKQIDHNIELIRYKRFGQELLLFELVNATTTSPKGQVISAPIPESAAEGATLHKGKTFAQYMTELDDRTRDLYDGLTAFIRALGDDVQEKELKQYIAFKRIKNFACIEVFPSDRKMKLFLKIDPDSIALEEGFSRDMRGIGHYGTGDLQVTIDSKEDLDRARDLIIKSYENS